MTSIMPARSGIDPAHSAGQIRLGRGERETRGEHRGRGERLPSGSRFVFLVLLLPLLLVSAPLGAQERPTGFSVGLRISGVAGTNLIEDALGESFFPDSTIRDHFDRDTVIVQSSIAPDITLALVVPLSDDTDIQLAAGYTIGRLQIVEGGETRDAGGLGTGHAVLSAQKPIRGVLARLGAGALWFSGSDATAMREMRRLNPMLELAAARRWTFGSYDVEAALVGQGAQIASTALEARQGPPGLVYRLGIELGLLRRIGR